MSDKNKLNKFKCCVCNLQPKSAQKVSFHNFPRNNDPKRHQQWLQFVRRVRNDDTWQPFGTSRVCSQHFSATDFERNPAVQVGIPFMRNCLTKTAIPSVITTDGDAISSPSKVRRKPKPLSPKKADPKEAARTTNFELCQIRSQLAGKNVEIDELNSQLEQQKIDFQKLHYEETRKFEAAIKAGLAKQKSLENTIERQDKRLKKTLLEKQAVEMKLRESRSEIKRLTELLKSSVDEIQPKKKVKTVELVCDGPIVPVWSSDSE